MFDSFDSVGARGELDLIGSIRAWLGSRNPPSPEGIGDDCAVFLPPPGTQALLTTDALSYGQHFDRSVSAREAGIKLVNRNLSDIAAMGGTPDRAILCLLFGPDLAYAWLRDFVLGAGAAAEKEGLRIVGGDISRLEKGCFTSMLTVFGHSGRPLFRGGAAAGDHIFVTGDLGGSIEGKHFRFRPRLREGRWLAEDGRCTSLMDLTDGLAKDLPNLLPESLGARIDLDRVPVDPAAQRVAARQGGDAMEHAFCDGEDYELLFTVSGDTEASAFAAAWHQAFPDLRLSRIGQAVAVPREGRVLDHATGRPLPWTRGFEHFRAE